MYKDEYHTTHIPAILLDPGVGEMLVGDLAGIRSYHLKIANQQYRLAYRVSEAEEKLFVLMIAKREVFYTVLKRRT